jgi:hypothetical protein
MWLRQVYSSIILSVNKFDKEAFLLSYVLLFSSSR